VLLLEARQLLAQSAFVIVVHCHRLVCCVAVSGSSAAK
jgi:hypothetical protein